MIMAAISPGAYWGGVVLGGATCALLCLAGRRHPGRFVDLVCKGIGAVLFADVLAYSIGEMVAGTWSPKTSLPLALCNVAVLVAGVACWWKTPLLVELTWFWGLAGTLQGLLTPDLGVSFPHLVFFEYLGGHLSVVVAALFLVVGARMTPRRGALWRVLAISIGYTIVVGAIDWLYGANYMFLRRAPGEWTLLRLLGPWPYYIFSAVIVAALVFELLDHRSTS